MDAEQFEEMCCALVDKEPAIKTADRYQTQRQQQFGIDIIGQRNDGAGIEVASCKCYSRLTKGQIGGFSDEFLDHWHLHWHDKNVHQFILCVATDVRSSQRQKEISAEHERFKALGIDYEVWGPRQLQERLRAHDGIVSQYLGPEWIPHVCGRPQPASAPPSSGQAFLKNVVVSQLRELQSALSEELKNRIEAAREQLRHGDRCGVEAELTALRADEVRWSAMEPDIKARAVRLQASLCLFRNETAQAEKLADEADGFALAEEPRLRALIAYRHKGPKLALEALGTPKSRDGQNLQVAFLLENGEAGRALDLLAESPAPIEDPEALRLEAYAKLMQGERGAALEAIRKAEQIAPEWVAIQHAGAVVRYATALSPSVRFRPSAWPNALPLDLVREDDVARRLLEEAEERFANLLERAVDEEERCDLQICRLACLANLRTRATKAQAYFHELLGESKTQAGVIAWALARGYEFDHRRVGKALKDLLDVNRGESDHVLALAALHLFHDRARRAKDTLSQYADRFQTEPERSLLSHWRIRVMAASQDVDMETSVDSMPIEDAFVILATRCAKAKECEPLIQFADRNRNDPALVYGATQALAEAGFWDAVVRYKDLLVENVATASAVSLAAFAAFNSGDPAACLSIIEQSVSAFPSCQLPLDLRRLQVAASRSTGDFASAGRFASALASQTQATSDLLSLIQTKIEAGDLTSALPPIRQVSKAEDLKVQDALQLSEFVRHPDPPLARDLLLKAMVKGVPHQLAGNALQLSLTLGLGEEAHPLYTTLDALQDDGEIRTVKRVDFDEAVEIFKQERKRSEQLTKVYFDGKAPIHLVAAAGNANLGKIFWRAFSHHGKNNYFENLPLLIQHGSRRTPESFTIPFEQWRLHLDITALIVAEHLALLDVIENPERPLVIPHMLPQALLYLEQDARPIQPDRIQALEAVIRGVDRGKIDIAVSCSLDATPAAMNGLPDDIAKTLLRVRPETL